jgi:phosphomevalonate kinase
MTLENRVKALEYEVKILKNEIQQVLLDIQEQLLMHYYPSLRADESSPSESIRRSIEAIQRKKAALERTESQDQK